MARCRDLLSIPSLKNLKLDGEVLNIPLFMADYTNRLIGAALEQRSRF